MADWSGDEIRLLYEGAETYHSGYGRVLFSDILRDLKFKKLRRFKVRDLMAKWSELELERETQESKLKPKKAQVPKTKPTKAKEPKIKHTKAIEPVIKPRHPRKQSHPFRSPTIEWNSLPPITIQNFCSKNKITIQNSKEIIYAQDSPPHPSNGRPSLFRKLAYHHFFKPAAEEPLNAESSPSLQVESDDGTILLDTPLGSPGSSDNETPLGRPSIFRKLAYHHSFKPAAEEPTESSPSPSLQVESDDGTIVLETPLGSLGSSDNEDANNMEVFNLEQMMEIFVEKSPHYILDLCDPWLKVGSDFWANLLDKDLPDRPTTGWLEESHIRAWTNYLLRSRKPDDDWTVMGPDFFNAFTYSNYITQQADGSVSRWPPWWSVKRVFFPVNWNDNHWILGMLDLQTWKLFIFDSSSDVYGPHFDVEKVYGALFKHFRGKIDWFLQLINYFEKVHHKFVKVRLERVKVPQQDNDRDCGIFTCKNMYQLTKFKKPPLACPEEFRLLMEAELSYPSNAMMFRGFMAGQLSLSENVFEEIPMDSDDGTFVLETPLGSLGSDYEDASTVKKTDADTNFNLADGTMSKSKSNSDYVEEDANPLLPGSDSSAHLQQDLLIEPFWELTPEDCALVGEALSDASRMKALVTHENSNITITGEVLRCLRPGAWLNDEVINLYLELLKERERKEPKKFLKCHFFNTFFYKKLIGGTGGYDYNSVRGWTSQGELGYNLLECDKIFVPVHKEKHWCLAVINKKEKKFQYLDSLGGGDSQVMRVLKQYIVDEVKDKNGEDIDVTSWKQEFVADLPNQKNGFDCGVFMIKYADFYSRDIGLCFKQKDMPYFRLRTAKEILKLRAE